MTSQILAIFYLNDLDYFIKETLKIKCVIRYQDDFLIFHHSKEYLQYRNKFGGYARYRTVKRRLAKKEYLYSIGKLSLSSLVDSRICYKHLSNNKLNF